MAKADSCISQVTAIVDQHPSPFGSHHGFARPDVSLRSRTRLGLEMKLELEPEMEMEMEMELGQVGGSECGEGGTLLPGRVILGGGKLLHAEAIRPGPAPSAKVS
jgi:hypothetical protein